MTRISDLPIGAKVVDLDTKFDGRVITWIIADKNYREYPENTVTLISERVLPDRKFDSSKTGYKNSRLREWINDDNGLLKDFSSDFKNATATTSINTASGNVKDKMFLASINEVDPKGWYKFPIFTDNNSRKGLDFNNRNATWWTRTAHSSSYVYCINSSGYLSQRYPLEDHGVRPLCNVYDSLIVSKTPNTTNQYTITKWNEPPCIIMRSEGELINGEYKLNYMVVDTDKGQTITVEEYIDGKKIKSFSARSQSEYTYCLSKLEYQKLSNGQHIVKILANDNRGGVTEEIVDFTKNETKIHFELAKPLEADAMVTKATINLVGSIPEKAILKVQACNNGHDARPTWEDVTTKVIKERKIFFANKQKTASKWGVNVRVSMDRNGATGECYISSIGGSYE